MTANEQPTNNEQTPEAAGLLKHTVFFSRKISDGNYGSEEASWFLQFDTNLGAAFESIQAEAMTAFTACKSVVLEQLGIGYELGENGTIVETGKPVAAQRDAVSQAREAFGGGNVVTGDFGGSDTYDAEQVKAMKSDDQQVWLKARLESHPREFYDNRKKKESGEFSSKAPDYKHIKLDLPIWPPRAQRSA